MNQLTNDCAMRNDRKLLTLDCAVRNERKL